MPRGHSLDFIKNVYTDTRKGWSVETAVKFTHCIQTQMRKNGIFKFDAAKASKATGMSRSGCQFFLKELKQANDKGWTVEQYFAKGRPFRYGKKVLA